MPSVDSTLRQSTGVGEQDHRLGSGFRCRHVRENNQGWCIGRRAPYLSQSSGWQSMEGMSAQVSLPCYRAPPPHEPNGANGR